MLYVSNLLVVFQVLLERSSLPFTGASSRVVVQVRFFRAHPTLRTLLATDTVAGCEVLSLLQYRLSRKGLGHASDSLVREVTLQFFLRWLVAAFPHYLALRIRLIVVVLGSEHCECGRCLQLLSLHPLYIRSVASSLDPCYFLNRTK